VPISGNEGISAPPPYLGYAAEWEGDPSSVSNLYNDGKKEERQKGGRLRKHHDAGRKSVAQPVIGQTAPHRLAKKEEKAAKKSSKSGRGNDRDRENPQTIFSLWSEAGHRMEV